MTFITIILLKNFFQELSIHCIDLIACIQCHCTSLIAICDLASENQPYDIFNPNGVISIML